MLGDDVMDGVIDRRVRCGEFGLGVLDFASDGPFKLDGGKRFQERRGNRLHAAFVEQVEFGAVLVDLLRLRLGRLELSRVEFVAARLRLRKGVLHKPLIDALYGGRCLPLGGHIDLRERRSFSSSSRANDFSRRKFIANTALARSSDGPRLSCCILCNRFRRPTLRGDLFVRRDHAVHDASDRVGNFLPKTDQASIDGF